MCVLLGISGTPTDSMIEGMKDFLIQIWNKRNQSDYANVRVRVNEHQYGRYLLQD